MKLPKFKRYELHIKCNECEFEEVFPFDRNQCEGTDEEDIEAECLCKCAMMMRFSRSLGKEDEMYVMCIHTNGVLDSPFYAIRVPDHVIESAINCVSNAESE